MILNSLKFYYQNVFIVYDLIKKITEANSLSQEDVIFLKNVVIGSEKKIKIEQLHLNQNGRDVNALKKIIKSFLNKYYCNRYIKDNHIDETQVYLFFTQSSMKFFFNLLTYQSIFNLIQNCSFFQIIQNQQFLQKTGFYFSNFIYQKKTPLLKVVKSKPLDQSSNQRQTHKTQNFEKQKKVKINCDEWCLNKENRKKWTINKKKMFYYKSWKNHFNSYLDLSCDVLLKSIFATVDQILKKDLQFSFLSSLFNQIIATHKKCKFDNLLKATCPINETGDKVCLDSTLNVENALKNYSSHSQVISFIYKIFYHIFPFALFGSKSNMRNIYVGLKSLVLTGIKVKLKISNIRGDKFNIDQCKWLDNFQCFHKKLHIFDHFLYWLTEYFISLLGSKFYVTESKTYQPFFYRYDCWSSIQSTFIKKLKFEKVLKSSSFAEYKKILRCDCPLLRLSNCRLIPRTHKLRMINKLRYSSLKSESHACLRVLSYFLRKIIQTSASQRYKNNMIGLQKVFSNMQVKDVGQLFFIKIDIANCYPSINQSKLFELICLELNSMVSLNDKMITMNEMDVVKPLIDKLTVKKYSYFENEQDEFIQRLTLKNNSPASFIFVPKICTTNYFFNDIKSLFQNYILKPFLRMGRRSYYQLEKGIRQGGALSSDLCCLYIEYILDQVVGSFGKNQGEERLIQEDDMVFITTSSEKAQFYLHLMLNKFPNFGLNINIKKLQYNFDAPFLKQPLISSSNCFLFHGRKIYLESMKIVTSYDQYYNHVMQYTFNCNPFVSKKHLVKNLVCQINLALCYWDFDFGINKELTVVLNIYERSILQTMRLSCFVLLSPNLKSVQRKSFVVNFVLRLANRFYETIERWKKEKVIICFLTKDEIKWIVAKAFQWHWFCKKVRHRIEEIKAVNEMLKKLEKCVDFFKRLKWSEYFNNNINPVFTNIKLINEKR